MQAQAKIAEIQAKAQADAQLLQLEYQLRGQIEGAKIQASAGMKQQDMQFRRSLESEKDDRKDDRVKSKLLSSLK